MLRFIYEQQDSRMPTTLRCYTAFATNLLERIALFFGQFHHMTLRHFQSLQQVASHCYEARLKPETIKWLSY